MGMLYECDQCGRQARTIRGWRIVKIPEGPKPLLCSGKCVILWERRQAAARAAEVIATTKRRRWWKGSSRRS